MPPTNNGPDEFCDVPDDFFNHLLTDLGVQPEEQGVDEGYMLQSSATDNPGIRALHDISNWQHDTLDTAGKTKSPRALDRNRSQQERTQTDTHRTVLTGTHDDATECNSIASMNSAPGTPMDDSTSKGGRKMVRHNDGHPTMRNTKGTPTRRTTALSNAAKAGWGHVQAVQPSTEVLSPKKQKTVDIGAAVHQFPQATHDSLVLQSSLFYHDEDDGTNYSYKYCAPENDHLWCINVQNANDAVYLHTRQPTPDCQPPMYLSQDTAADGSAVLQILQLDDITACRDSLQQAGGWAYRHVPQGPRPGWYLHQLLSFPDAAGLGSNPLSQLEAQISTSVCNKVINQSNKTHNWFKNIPFVPLPELEQGYLYDTSERKFLQGKVTGVRKCKVSRCLEMVANVFHCLARPRVCAERGS